MTHLLGHLFLPKLNAFLLILIFLGTAFIQVFIGGMRPVFAIPGYLVLAVAGIASLFLLPRRRPMPSMLCLGSSLVFFSYILWRAYVSPVEYLSRPDRYMVLACLVVYLVFALYVTEPRTRLYFFYGLFLLAVGHIVVGAIQFTKGENYLPFNYLRADYGRRASGFYVCPNHYAGLLEMLAIMAASITCWARIGIKTRMLVLYFTGMAIAGFALAGSRGGYLSIAGGFIAFAVGSVWVVSRIRPARTLLIGGAALGFLFFGGVAGVALMRKDVMLSQRLDWMNDTTNMRLQLWDAAMRQYHSEPVIGTGAGTYLYLGRLYRDPRVDTDPVWVHNDYLHLLAEYGYLGAIGCGLFLLVHLGHGMAGIRLIIKNRLIGNNDTKSSALALNLGAIVAVVAILVHSVVDFNAHIAGNAIVLAALFGILANPPTFRTREEAPALWPTVPFRILIGVCAGVLCVDAAPHLRGEWYSEKARVALRDQRYLIALREAQRGLEVETTNPDLHYYLGEARRLLGNRWTSEEARNKMNEAAIRAFADSIRIFPQDEKVWVKMSQAYDMTGQHEAALNCLEKARELDPHLAALNAYFGAHYQIQGDDKRALEYYQKAQAFEIGRKGMSDLVKQIKTDGAR